MHNDTMVYSGCTTVAVQGVADMLDSAATRVAHLMHTGSNRRAMVMLRGMTVRHGNEKLLCQRPVRGSLTEALLKQQS